MSSGNTQTTNPRHRLAPRRIVGGFTLIELLVVVGIIALLIAILLPALARARQEAYKISCAGNMRQWGTAAHAYSNENNNFFPNNMAAHSHLPTHHSNRLLNDFVEVFLMEFDEEATDAGENVVTHCPTVEYGRFHPTTFVSGYFYLPHRPSSHGSIDWHVDRGWYAKRRFDAPYGRAPIMSDTWWRQSAGGLEDWDGIGYRAAHMFADNVEDPLGSNFLFEDGSVNWHNADAVTPGITWSNDREVFFRIPVPGLAN